MRACWCVDCSVCTLGDERAEREARISASGKDLVEGSAVGVGRRMVCLRVDEDNGGHSNISALVHQSQMVHHARKLGCRFLAASPLDKDGAGFWRAAGFMALRQLGCVSGLFLLCLWFWVQFWCRSGYIVCHEILPAKCILKPNKEETTEETNMKASK